MFYCVTRVYWMAEWGLRSRVVSELGLQALAAVSCEPDGAHGAMLQHDIPAVTLADAAVRGTRKISEDAAVTAELLFRAFNNMTQRFNQCYYFYFFVDCATFRFVPVSQ